MSETLSPTQRANRLREQGINGAFMDGTNPDNKNYLTSGGERALETGEHSPSLSRKSNAVHRMIEIAQEQEGEKIDVRSE